MKFSLTQEDVDLARKDLANPTLNFFRSSHCPVAKCIGRNTGKSVSVGIVSVDIPKDASTYEIYELPLNIKEFIVSFDMNKPLPPLPIEFQLGRQLTK